MGFRHETAATALGGDVHKVREKYLTTGEPIDQTSKAGLIASVGLTQIPGPGEVIVEREFSRWIRSRRAGVDGGLAFHGLIDMLSLPGYPKPESPAFLGDHKTTSDLKYAKSEAELRTDPQWNIYVDYGFALSALSHLDIDEIHTLWHYVTTKKPFVAKPVWLVAKRDDGQRIAEIAQLEIEAREIEAIRRNPPNDVNELRPNLAACGDYGGCPFRGAQCASGLGSFFESPKKVLPVLGPANPVEPEKETGNMSAFQDRIAAMRAGGAAPAPEAPAPAATAPAQGVNPPAARRPPGRPPGSPNKPKEEVAAPAALSIDLGPIVELLKAIAAEQARHHAALEEHAAAANEIAMARLEAGR